MTEINNQPALMSSEHLVFLFRRASRLMARVYHQRAHAHHAQGHILSIIRERGPIKQRDLLEQLDVRSSSLSEVLAKLERSGLIIRKRDENDKRGFVISVKEGAASSLLARQDGYQESVDALFAVLDDEERHQLGELLNKVIQALEGAQSFREVPGKARKHGRNHKRGGKQGHGFRGKFQGRGRGRQ